MSTIPAGEPPTLEPIPLMRQLADSLRRASLDLRTFREFEEAARDLPASGTLTPEQLNLLTRVVRVHREHVQELETVLSKIGPTIEPDAPTATQAYRELDYPLLCMIERTQLQQHRPEAEVMLRMGAFANVLTALVRRYPFQAKTRADRRDRLHLSIMSAAYLHECRYTMNDRHNGLGWELVLLAQKAGRPDPPAIPFAALKTLLEPGSAFGMKVARIRDKFAFHFDRDPFLNWLDAQDGYDAMLMYMIGGRHASNEIVFDASAKAVAAAFQELEEPGFGHQLASAINAIPHVADALVRGFMQKFGLVVDSSDRQIDFAGEFTEY